jgi:hypothetical protein
VVLATNQEHWRASLLERNLRGVLPIEGIAFSGPLGAVRSDATYYPAAERWLDIEGRGRDVVFVDDSLECSRRNPRLVWCPLQQAIRLACPDHVSAGRPHGQGSAELGGWTTDCGTHPDRRGSSRSADPR